MVLIDIKLSTSFAKPEFGGEFGGMAFGSRYTEESLALCG